MRLETFFVMIDKLLAELQKRKACYESLNQLFGFLLNLQNLENHSIKSEAKRLVEIYTDDLEDNFIQEVFQFKGLAAHFEMYNAIDMLRFVKTKNLNATFPNVEIALRLYVCIPVSNCSGEQSFSMLKRVTSYLRSTLANEKLNSLAILSIESDITNVTTTLFLTREDDKI